MKRTEVFVELVSGEYSDCANNIVQASLPSPMSPLPEPADYVRPFPELVFTVGDQSNQQRGCIDITIVPDGAFEALQEDFSVDLESLFFASEDERAFPPRYLVGAVGSTTVLIRDEDGEQCMAVRPTTSSSHPQHVLATELSKPCNILCIIVLIRNYCHLHVLATELSKPVLCKIPCIIVVGSRLWEVRSIM